MRISCDKEDPGYCCHVVGVKVIFNGIERNGVITADEEARQIVIARRDERGNFVLTQDKAEIEKEVLYGDVAIVLPDGHPLAIATTK